MYRFKWTNDSQHTPYTNYQLPLSRIFYIHWKYIGPWFPTQKQEFSKKGGLIIRAYSVICRIGADTEFWMRWGAKNFIAHEAHENILALHPNFWCHTPNWQIGARRGSIRAPTFHFFFYQFRTQFKAENWRIFWIQWYIKWRWGANNFLCGSKLGWVAMMGWGPTG